MRPFWQYFDKRRVYTETWKENQQENKPRNIRKNNKHERIKTAWKTSNNGTAEGDSRRGSDKAAASLDILPHFSPQAFAISVNGRVEFSPLSLCGHTPKTRQVQHHWENIDVEIRRWKLLVESPKRNVSTAYRTASTAANLHQWCAIENFLQQMLQKKLFMRRLRCRDQVCSFQKQDDDPARSCNLHLRYVT